MESILAALAAGAAAAAKDTVQQAVKDSYSALKKLVLQRFGKKGDVAHALEQLEKKPDSEARKGALSEELADAGADKDADLLRRAQELIVRLKKDGLITAQGPRAEIHGPHATVAQDCSTAVSAPGGIAVGRDVNIAGGVLKVTETRERGAVRGSSPEDLRTAYLNRILEKSRSLSLTGIDPRLGSDPSARLRLDAVYTALLTLSQQRPEKDDCPEHDPALRSTHGERRLTALEHLNRKKRLVLLGDPGSGKSTFVSFLGACMSGESLGDRQTNLAVLTEPPPSEDASGEGEDDAPKAQPWDHGALLPVCVVLRDFAARGLPKDRSKATASHLWEFIEAELKSSTLEKYGPILHAHLQKSGGLVLLDGLDEVPEAKRRRVQIKQAVEDFARSFPKCRMLVTSRKYAYENQAWRLDDFNEAVLAPFSEGQIRCFIDRWYAHVGSLRGLGQENTRGRAELLKHAVFGSERLLEMAERPLLLTLMASLHSWRGGSLPEKREELYSDTVKLLLDHWESQRVVYDGSAKPVVIQPSLAEFLKVDQEEIRVLLNELAFKAHSLQTDSMDTADVAENEVVAGLMRLSEQSRGRSGDMINPGRLMEYLTHRAGLLLPRGVGVYTFPHRTFQEYLAACHLTDLNYPQSVAELARKDPDRWREVALLAAAKAARGASSSIWLLVDALCPLDPKKEAMEPEDPWGALIAGLALAELIEPKAKVLDWCRPKLSRVIDWQIRIIGSGVLPAVERAKAGDALGRLGDPRFDGALWCLPDDPDEGLLGFREVAGGKFVMASGEHSHEVALPTFYMARYPVTVAQFRAFVEDTGLRPADKDSLRGIENHPVVWVTWHEALAYARWLDERLKGIAGERLEGDLSAEERRFWERLLRDDLYVTLPSEAEWEKAARGEGGRMFPWGEGADPEKANYDETKIGGTSAVGCFSGGASPYRCEDMSGNVWEWTRSLWGKDWGKAEYGYPYKADDGREDLKAPGEVLRVLRGGSFGSDVDDVRCACRFGPLPYDGVDFGFRVVVSPFS